MTTCIGNGCLPGCRWCCLRWRLYVLSFFYEVSWMRSGASLRQFLRVSYLLFPITMKFNPALRHYGLLMLTIRPRSWYTCQLLTYSTLILKSTFKSRKENPQKLTQLSSRSHLRYLVGKRTAQKDTIIDITSDSQMNSNFPYRWSPASLTFNNYFYLFLYLYITWITINNNVPHLKSPKNQNRRTALGRPAIKITGGL